MKAKVKQAFPNIIWDSMPSDHLSGRELKAGLISKIKTKSHSCLISFPVDIIPHVDWHEKKTGQRAAHDAPLGGCHRMLWAESFGKGQG